MKKREFPAFEVKAHGASTASVHWIDGRRRYHIWLGHDDETPDGRIHSNALDMNVSSFGPEGHRTINPHGPTWRPVIAHFVAEIKKGDLVTKARKAAADCERDTANLKHAAWLDRVRKSLEERGHGDIAALSDDAIESIADAIHKA